MPIMRRLFDKQIPGKEMEPFFFFKAVQIVSEIPGQLLLAFLLLHIYTTVLHLLLLFRNDNTIKVFP